MQTLQLLNLLNFILPLLWLVAILIHWFRKSEVNLKQVKAGIYTVLTLWAIVGVYSTVATYNLWSADPLSRYLLPPHNPISYFLGYAFFHYWLKYGIIIMLSLAWAFMLWLINKFSKNRFLDKADIYLGFFAGLASGWPNFIFFIILFFGLMLAHQIINVVIFRKNEPLEVAPYLIASAIIVLLIGEFLINRLNLGVLRI